VADLTGGSEAEDDGVDQVAQAPMSPGSVQSALPALLLHQGVVHLSVLFRFELAAQGFQDSRRFPPNEDLPHLVQLAAHRGDHHRDLHLDCHRQHQQGRSDRCVPCQTEQIPAHRQPLRTCLKYEG